MHAAKKETNRILLPYTLTKKAPPPTAGKPKPLSTGSKASDTRSSAAFSLAKYGSDSDDDDGDSSSAGNFFSLDSSSKSKNSSSVQDEGLPLPAVSSKVPAVNEVSTMDTGVPTVQLPPEPFRSSMRLPAPSHSSSTSEDEPSNLPNSKSHDTGLQNVNVGAMPPPPGPSHATAVDADAPLVFKSGVTNRHASLQGPSQGVGPMLPQSHGGANSYQVLFLFSIYKFISSFFTF